MNCESKLNTDALVESINYDDCVACTCLLLYRTFYPFGVMLCGQVHGTLDH